MLGGAGAMGNVSEQLGSCFRYRTPPSQYWILAASRAPPGVQGPSGEEPGTYNSPDTGSAGAVQIRYVRCRIQDVEGVGTVGLYMIGK